MLNRCQIDLWGRESEADSRVGSGGSVPNKPLTILKFESWHSVSHSVVQNWERCFRGSMTLMKIENWQNMKGSGQAHEHDVRISDSSVAPSTGWMLQYLCESPTPPPPTPNKKITYATKVLRKHGRVSGPGSHQLPLPPKLLLTQTLCFGRELRNK